MLHAWTTQALIGKWVSNTSSREDIVARRQRAGCGSVALLLLKGHGWAGWRTPAGTSGLEVVGEVVGPAGQNIGCFGAWSLDHNPLATWNHAVPCM